jgi:hypothetical protein
MNREFTYDQSLRAIGQALEGYRLVGFSVKSEGDKFVVQGETGKTHGLKAWLRIRKPFGQKTFSKQDIEQLEHQGRAKRKAPDRLPDFRSMPNVFRAIGAFLEMNEGRLLEVCGQGQTVVILFQNKAGHPQLEERTLSFLSDLSVRLYQQRHNKRRA